MTRPSGAGSRGLAEARTLACASALFALSCANSTAPPPPADAGHDSKTQDATVDASCGALGQKCCEPPTLCDPGAFCAPDDTCKTLHPPDLGKPCSTPTACASLICGYTQGIADGAAPVPDGNGTPPPQATGCTVGCAQTSDCLAGWTCDQLNLGQGQCVCNWGPEICDGEDNNCDGIVDNEPEVDNYCTLMAEGLPQKCVHGACICDNMCGTTCVDLQSDDMNCGRCGRACAADQKCVGGECGCAFTICGGKCIDTKGSDNENCGKCGEPCPYQCESGICGPATFATGLKNPGAIVTDATNVYWLDEGSGHVQVQYCPLSGCVGGKPKTLAVSSGKSSYGKQLGTLVLTGKDVYFSDDSGDIETSPITGGSGTASRYAAGDSTASYLTVSGSDLFWANNSSETVDSCALGTSCAKVTSIANLNAKSQSPTGIAVSGGIVYVASLGGFGAITIQSVPVGGGTVTEVCKHPGFAFSVPDLLVADGNAYFTSGGAVHVCSLSATGATSTAFANGKSLSGLATDGTDLYWTENRGAGSIAKCALGTKCASVTTLASDVKSPDGIAVAKKQIYFTSPANGTVSVFHD